MGVRSGRNASGSAKWTGLRCVAKFVHDHGIATRPRLAIETGIRLVVIGVGLFLVWFGCVNFLRGFGSFRLRKREPRKGRNPKTGDKVDVPPKKVPYFKPGKELKDLINRESEDGVESPAGTAPPDALAV